MAKLIDAFRSFLIRLILPQPMLADVTTEAARRNISVSVFVRGVLKRHLDLTHGLTGRQATYLRLNKVDLNEPIGNLTPEQQQYADECMRIFREEDR